jgi:hypothetical protein
MKKLPINDPAYWRERADEARRSAEQLADAVAKQTMLEIANSYDNLAVLRERARLLRLQPMDAISPRIVKASSVRPR